MSDIDPNQLCQIEIHVSDLRRSLTFYEGVFGWRAAPAEIHDYVVLDVPEDCPFGIALAVNKAARSSGSRSVLYFRVDDPKAIAERVEAHGGTLVFGPAKLGGYGTVYRIRDPDGQTFGLFAPQT